MIHCIQSLETGKTEVLEVSAVVTLAGAGVRGTRKEPEGTSTVLGMFHTLIWALVI